MTPAAPAPVTAIDEPSARQVLLLRAFEDSPEELPQWTGDDRAWASRLAREAAGADAGAVHFVCTRAHHAAQRLRSRSAEAASFLQARFSLRPWLLAALLLGWLAGVAVDQIGPSQRINLLAVPMAALLVWNLAVYGLLALRLLALRLLVPTSVWPTAWRGLRQRLPAMWRPAFSGSAPLQRLGVDWARASAPLNAARAALLVHVAAAALALGVLAGLYARGLVLDYRAGWQSSLLEPATVQQGLAWALAPASAITGIAVPDVQTVAALRVTANTPATGPAAMWLHLFATSLALFVIGPRLLLAAVAAWRVGWLVRHWTLPWQDAYFQALQRSAAARAPRVWLLPHGVAPAAAPALALQAWLNHALGAATPLRVADPVGLGSEHEGARCSPPADTTLVLVLVDMAATPEPEAQGQLLQTLASCAGSCQRLLVVDETAFLARFGTLQQRLQQRRQAWQQLADRFATPLVGLNLSRPLPDPTAVAALRRLIEP